MDGSDQDDCSDVGECEAERLVPSGEVECLDAGGSDISGSVVLQVLSLSGEAVLGPLQMIATKRISDVARLLKAPPTAGYAAVLLHDGVPLYDMETQLSSLRSDTDISSALDLNLVWWKQPQKGDRVSVHEDITTSVMYKEVVVPSGQEGCVLTVHIPHNDLRATFDDSLEKHTGDMLVSFPSVGNVWVHRKDLHKLHVGGD